MADATAQVTLNLGPREGNIGLPMDASQEFFAGAAVAMSQITGYTKHMADASGYVFQGHCATYSKSDANKLDISNFNRTTGSVPAYMAIYPSNSGYAKSLAVTGVSAQTQWGDPVFMTDDQTYTVTAPADDRAPVGYIHVYRASGVADVVFFDPVTSILMTLIGVYGQAVIGTVNATFSTGVTYVKTMVGIAGLITNFVFSVGVAGAVTSSTVKVNADVNGGSQIFAADDETITKAAAVKGAEIITASTVVNTSDRAEFHDGDTINLDMADGTTQMTGLVALASVRYKRLFGA